MLFGNISDLPMITSLHMKITGGAGQDFLKNAGREPGGPDSEVFYDFETPHDPKFGESVTRIVSADGSWKLAIPYLWNTKKHLMETLCHPQRNVDFGGDWRRLNAAVNGTPDIFTTDSFSSIISIIEQVTKKTYGTNNLETTSMRIVADHIRGAVMMMADGVVPGNKQQGYMLRRLIRRSMLHMRKLGIWGEWSYIPSLVAAVITLYEDAYPEIVAKQDIIEKLFIGEAGRFGKTIEKD